jgi:hypothetical protein
MTTTVTLDLVTRVIDQLEWHWNVALRPRLDELTDDSYLWEPVPGCWSVRRRGEQVGAHAAGAGDHVMDIEFPEPSPPPVTTIAWRMGHVAIGVFGIRASAHGGDGSVTYGSTDWPTTAAGGLALLDHHHDAWLTHLRSLDADGFEAPCGPAEGPYAEYPFLDLVLHINREALHHGAEIMLLLDLYRASGGAPLRR